MCPLRYILFLLSGIVLLVALLFFTGGSDEGVICAKAPHENEKNENETTSDKFWRVYRDVKAGFALTWMFFNGKYLYNVYHHGFQSGFTGKRQKSG